MDAAGWIPVSLGILGLVSAWIVYGYVKRFPEGEGKVVEISSQFTKAQWSSCAVNTQY